MSDQFINRISRTADKNKTRLVKCLREDPHLVRLVAKARGHELSIDEKEELRVALIGMLRAVPAFAMISLPEKFLTLPVLLKVLPRSLFDDGSK